MTIVSKNDITKAAAELGISKGDCVLVHSSLKSLGYVDGGADSVIDGFIDAVGTEGTLVFPTLCQQDWENVYKNWHMDAPSDVGYITNVFRKRHGALRSNQATHSVAAIGKDAEYITKTHGETGIRIGIFGDTPFSSDSPWEKMYNMNAKIVFLGVSMLYCTFRHYAEYVFVEKCIEKIKNHSQYDDMVSALRRHGKEIGVWPNVRNIAMEEYMLKNGYATETTCGDAHVIMINAREFVDLSMKFLESMELKYLACSEETRNWVKKIYSLSGGNL